MQTVSIQCSHPRHNARKPALEETPGNENHLYISGNAIQEEVPSGRICAEQTADHNYLK